MLDTVHRLRVMTEAESCFETSYPCNLNVSKTMGNVKYNNFTTKSRPFSQNLCLPDNYNQCVTGIPNRIISYFSEISHNEKRSIRDIKFTNIQKRPKFKGQAQYGEIH
jgi:hypothetical protein